MVFPPLSLLFRLYSHWFLCQFIALPFSLLHYPSLLSMFTPQEVHRTKQGWEKPYTQRYPEKSLTYLVFRLQNICPIDKRWDLPQATSSDNSEQAQLGNTQWGKAHGNKFKCFIVSLLNIDLKGLRSPRSLCLAYYASKSSGGQNEVSYILRLNGTG